MGPALDGCRAIADTAGDNADYPVPELHRYRDYIIAALNNDKPYDEFVASSWPVTFSPAAAPDDRYAERSHRHWFSCSIAAAMARCPSSCGI